MSQSAGLLHSICPRGIACMCMGLSGITNVLYIHMALCLCARIFIKGQLHRLKASNKQRAHIFTRILFLYWSHRFPFSVRCQRPTQKTETGPSGRLFRITYSSLLGVPRKVSDNIRTNHDEMAASPYLIAVSILGILSSHMYDSYRRIEDFFKALTCL